MTIVLEGTLTTDQTLTYIYLPFEMPEDTARIDVSYSYSAAISSDPQLTGGNTIDIGIFDVRGVAFLDAGFRGWSGSARQAFYIAADDATPGYLAGPLQAGTWYVCLGLYKIAEQGCEYRVEIDVTPAATPQTVDFPAFLPLRDTPPAAFKPKADGWYRGELHCHTFNSDGDGDPLEVVRKAEALGLDFLAITDHNVQTQQIALRTAETPLILIPGYEVTTYFGHWNIWGDAGWIDFRSLTAEQLDAAMQAATDKGYLVSCNHPRPYGPAWTFKDVTRYQTLEVWNGPWEVFNADSLAFWEERLGKGARPTVVGGSDSHFHHRDHIAQLAHPTNWIYCETTPSAAALLDAIRKGRVSISESPDGAFVSIRSGDAMMGDVVAIPENGQFPLEIHVKNAADSILELYSEKGQIGAFVIPNDDWTLTTHLSIQARGYVRAQVTAVGMVRAITNPIYYD